LPWPRAARAQQSGLPTIGFLHSGSPEETARRLEAYRKGLNEQGFTEGGNFAIEYRWAAGQNDKLPDMAADLIRRNVAVISTAGSAPASQVARRMTSTIPVVFGTGGDPVELGLVESLNRPGGNVTGVTSMNANITSKRVELLHQLAPQTSRYVALINPGSPLSDAFVKDLEAAAPRFGIHLDVLRAQNVAEIDAAFAGLPADSDHALLSCPDGYLYTRRAQITALALRHAMPSAFDVRDYVDIGGLLSYGADFLEVMRLAGNYTGRVLKGEKPADLPVVQSEKFEMIVNSRTAKSLGLTIPTMLLATADEVIE
jgi:putative tryptophan/tyrosine transport system substrate-binding protein